MTELIVIICVVGVLFAAVLLLALCANSSRISRYEERRGK